MTNASQFESLWNSYLEGELDEAGIAELQQLFALDHALLEAAADSFRTHRLLGLNAQDTEARHEQFVAATMAMLPQEHNAFVSQVMEDLPANNMKRAGSHRALYRSFMVTAVAVVVCAGFFFSRPSSEIARITGIHGRVQWTGKGGVVEEMTQVGRTLEGGTLEMVSADAWVDLRYRDDTTVTVSGRSLLTLSEQEQKIIHLRYGNLSANVLPQPIGCPMVVRTPSADLSVLGTRFDVDAQQEATTLLVSEGRVRLKRSGDGEEVNVIAQQGVTASLQDHQGLIPIERKAAVSAWKSNLKSDVVTGKWMSDLSRLSWQLKKAVAEGRMDRIRASEVYRDASTFDQGPGSVWAMPTSFGSLVVLSIVRETTSPVVLTPGARFQIRGRLLDQSVEAEFGISVNNPGGGFSGKFRVVVGLDAVPITGEPFTLELPLSYFCGDEKVGLREALTGKELRDWWCVTKSASAKLEILSVELIEE